MVPGRAWQSSVSSLANPAWRIPLASPCVSSIPWLMMYGPLATARCLGPFLIETCALIEAGVELEKLDKIMKSYGLPVGPITLADEVRSSRCYGGGAWATGR